MSGIKRVFLIVLDSMGCGHAPDAAQFGDEGANTLATIRTSKAFHCPYMERLGLFHIAGFQPSGGETPQGAYGRLIERSMAKDTTAGHWEIAGLVSEAPFPTYPEGFPAEVIEAIEAGTGRGTLCNRPYSGTEVIRDYGEEQLRTGKLIIYTSADSVCQIAAHEDLVPPEELYRYCRIARQILQGKHGVGRVIARPFTGTAAEGFTRVNAHRHDFSLLPPQDTMLDELQKRGLASIGIGKIRDIFAGKGLGERYTTGTTSNADGMEKTAALLNEDFHGLCFVNLVETDSVYGHRRDIDGYAGAISAFDAWLGAFMSEMRPEDVIMITADHGCDPGYQGTDHTREMVPFLAYGPALRPADLGTRTTYGDIGATILDLFGISAGTPGSDAPQITGTSFAEQILR